MLGKKLSACRATHGGLRRVIAGGHSPPLHQVGLVKALGSLSVVELGLAMSVAEGNGNQAKCAGTPLD